MAKHLLYDHLPRRVRRSTTLAAWVRLTPPQQREVINILYRYEYQKRRLIVGAALMIVLVIVVGTTTLLALSLM